MPLINERVEWVVSIGIQGPKQNKGHKLTSNIKNMGKFLNMASS